MGGNSSRKVKVGNGQEMTQSETNSHSTKRDAKTKCTSFRSVVFQLNMVGIRVHVLSRGFRKNGALVSEHFSVACI